MRNPFAETAAAADPEDRDLVRRAQAGDRESLEQLITRHQAWIYNIVLRMVYLPQDAEDATQEILVKLITMLRCAICSSDALTYPRTFKTQPKASKCQRLGAAVLFWCPTSSGSFLNSLGVRPVACRNAR